MIFCNISCFTKFSCIVSGCSETCCQGWEVDLDEDVLLRYRQLPGPLGDEIRSKIQTGDGYTFFALTGGRCPFLNEKNLCRLILSGGDALLSTTCREHPRFVEEYGDLRETCLSISCPEAARLLLTEPLTFTADETPDAAEPDPDLDEAYLGELLELRETLFHLVRLPQPERMARMLETAAPDSAIPRMDAFFEALSRMEFTSPKLPALLPKAAELARRPMDAALSPAADDAEQRLLLYFLYRYLLRAVWDGAAAEKLLFSICSARAILLLAEASGGALTREALISAASLYSREVEHSDENLELLYAFFRGNYA